VDVLFRGILYFVTPASPHQTQALNAEKMPNKGNSSPFLQNCKTEIHESSGV